MEREVWEESEKLWNSLLCELEKEFDGLKEDLAEVAFNVWNIDQREEIRKGEAIKSVFGERFYELCVLSASAGAIMGQVDQMCCEVAPDLGVRYTADECAATCPDGFPD